MKSVKNPATALRYFGININIPAANCMTPKVFQTIGETVSISEQGGSMKFKNLSAPIIKKRAAHIPAMMFERFMSLFFEVRFSVNSRIASKGALHQIRD